MRMSVPYMIGSGTLGEGAAMKRRDFLIGLGAAAGTPLFVAPVRPALASRQMRDLTARPGMAGLLGDGLPQTPIWGYDGVAPGPVLRFRQGQDVVIAFRNALDQPTSVHWHGLRVPNAMDGVAGVTQEPVPPQGSFEYRFRVEDAGTFWYHAHNRSWEQVARGLAGMLVVEEAVPPAVDHDVAMVLDDWRLENSGKIHEASFGSIGEWAHGGRLGNIFTVNGGPAAEIPVRAGDRVRLRLLNSANARILSVRFPGHAPLLVALDGQPVDPRPLGEEAVTLAPGQRADLMIDMTLAPGASAAIEEVSTREPYRFATFRYSPDPPQRTAPLDPPARLPDNPLPGEPVLDGALRVPLRMEGGAMGRMPGARIGDGPTMGMRELAAAGKVWAFNGVAGMPTEPLVSVKSGRTVVVDIENDNAWPHAMHLHGHHFRVVARNGNAVARSDWRDTELVHRGERVSIAFVAGGPGKWLLHCHMLEHHAGGMVTWVEVV